MCKILQNNNVLGICRLVVVLVFNLRSTMHCFLKNCFAYGKNRRVTFEKIVIVSSTSSGGGGFGTIVGMSVSFYCSCINIASSSFENVS